MTFWNSAAPPRQEESSDDEAEHHWNQNYLYQFGNLRFPASIVCDRVGLGICLDFSHATIASIRNTRLHSRQ
jgi:hypothetical protein